MISTIFENIINSLESIRANKLRSSLSMLGIIIGVSSVIILTAIGNGSTQDIVDKIEEMGTNVLTISAGGGFGSSRDRSTAQDVLDAGLVEEVKNSVEGLDGVLPIISSNGQLMYGANDMNSSVNGIDTNYFDVKAIEVEYGSNITQTHIDNLEKVAVIGQDVVSELFDDENPIGESFKMGNSVFEVIGIIEENSDLDSDIFIPLSTASIRIAGQKYYSNIIVVVSDADMVDSKETEIETVITAYLNDDLDNPSFSIRNESEMLESMSSVTETLTMLLSGIAGISLLVGGIGVMNIMLVSVTERTKEIGIRKAIGAGKSDILLQFLTEASSLSVIGGLIGIGFSYFVVYILNEYDIITAIISSDSIIISFAFSLGIGLIFGILPAYKAAKLRPIDALRFE